MIRLRTFGPPAVLDGDRIVSGAAGQPRRLALLALLAEAGQRGMTRDKLLFFLWPDATEERARKSLTQAVYALRRDLGNEDVLAGAHDLRLNTAIVSSDLVEFRVAVEEGRFDDAARMYEGPFLDGFNVSQLPEFEDWVERVRRALAAQYADAVVRVADAALSRGDYAAAVVWRRKLAAADPLNSRFAVALMEALAASGDRHGALQHARIYEALVKQELDLPADRDVIELANRLRRESPERVIPSTSPSTLPAATASDQPSRASQSTAEVPSGSASAVAPTASSPVASDDALPAPDRSGEPLNLRRRWTRIGAAVVVGSAAIVAISISLRGGRTAAAGPATSGPLLAVGRIADYRSTPTTELARPLGDMLATNLARAAGIHIVSTARMYELLSQAASVGDTGASAFTRAARHAGATQLVEGALFALSDGHLRLDLRLVELATGNVTSAHSVRGEDAFALADSGTALLASTLGGRAPRGSLADATTRSVAAYRLYEQGLRHYFADEVALAERLFDAALAEDSTFAAAAFFSARSTDDVEKSLSRYALAKRLAVRSGDLERLSIAAYAAWAVASPSYGALAETLSVRYPQEVDGHFHTGLFLLADARPLEAIQALERVVAMDSLGIRGVDARCTACEALQRIVDAYISLDSLPAAARTAQRWAQLQPRAPGPWRVLTTILARSGRPGEAERAYQRFASLASVPEGDPLLLTQMHMLHDEFDDAERILRPLTVSGQRSARRDAYWTLAILLRQQGRLAEALDAARAYGRLAPGDTSSTRASSLDNPAEAQVLFELGRFREASDIFEALSHRVGGGAQAPTGTAWERAWWLTHAASARAAMGDTAALRWMADTVEVHGRGSVLARNRLLHHYVRGLRLRLEGSHGEAAVEFRRGIVSPVLGHTRANYELAGELVRLGRSREAVALLLAALNGPLDGSNLYMTRTELRERLAEAWDAAGVPDSAAAEFRAVVQAWRRADPSFAGRVRHASDRMAVLAARR